MWPYFSYFILILLVYIGTIDGFLFLLFFFFVFLHAIDCTIFKDENFFLQVRLQNGRRLLTLALLHALS